MKHMKNMKVGNGLHDLQVRRAFNMKHMKNMKVGHGKPKPPFMAFMTFMVKSL
jgi:hypothetical protein